MALLFVAGVMNLLWVAAIAAFVLIEKMVPRGEIVGRAFGVTLIAAGMTMVQGIF
jgi:predicted metal-binding membrane protein